MSNRRRRDGGPTADEQQQQCAHVASEENKAICGVCGAEMPDDDGIDDLAKTLPPSDGPTSTAMAVEERQADAAADSAPAVGGGEAPAGDNAKSRYEIIKEKFERLSAIKAEQKVLRDEAADIIDDLEKQQGVNRGGLSEVRKLLDLDAATVKRREESRAELFALLIKPKLDEAEAGQADE